MRHTWRRLAHAPLFTTVAVVTLAAGIGANSAIFSVVNGVLLKPLPFEEPERLVGVWHKAPGLGFEELNMAPAFYLLYREDSRVFEDIGIWDTISVSVTGIAEPEWVQALLVTDGTLPVLRAQPVLGRRFTAEDDTPGSPETVILAYRYWQRKFGGDRSAVGSKLNIDGRPREIIGVMPQDFRFLNQNPALLLPMKINRSEVFVGNFSYQSVARLRPGVTMEQASAEVARIIPTALDRFPLPGGLTRDMFAETRLGPNLRPLKQDAVGDVGKVLWVLLGTVGIVLLIACANVGNLFLVRAEGRQQELAVRSALGAGRMRLAGELLSESLLLGIAGGAAGLLMASGGVQLLVALGPESLPRLEEITIDRPVLLFTFAISVLAGLAFGLIPAIKYTSPGISAALGEGGRVSDGRARHRARSVLVVSQIALALVLLIGSGLMVRTFKAMRSVQPGFERPEEVLTLRIAIPAAEVEDDEKVVRTHEEIMRRLSRIPGVASVGLCSSITMDGWDSNDPIFIEEFPSPDGQIPAIRRFKWVSPNFFETVGRPLLAGRLITWNDIYGRRPVVVFSENLAREYWEDPRQALGKRVRESPKSPWREIIGIVANEHDDGVDRKATPVAYWPMLISPFWDDKSYVQRNMAYAIRSGRLGTSTFMTEVQEAVWSVSPNLPLASVRTLEAIRRESMGRTSFTLVMLGIAAGVALLLGMVGIYGVIAYAASRRTREIGIRMALGAGQGAVRSMFLRHGLLLTITGLMLGLAGAAGLTRLMSALLFGVSPVDYATFAAASITLGGVALLASWLPARRASRIDPAAALRWE